MWYFYLFLGVLQGIFEWLPISSEGIICLVGNFLVKELNPLDFALFLHFGTWLASIFYFRKDLKEILLFKNLKLLRFLLISTLFSLIVGFPVYKLIKNMVFGTSLLLITGVGLLFTAYFNQKKINFKISFETLPYFAGILQGLAVIPGFSRSGATIFSLSFSNLKPEEILKISYLMSIPVVFLSTIYLFFHHKILILQAWPSLISSFLSGLFLLKILISLSKKMDFSKFALFFATLCFLGAILNFLF